MASLIKRSNGYFHLVTYLNGKRIWQSTGATTKSGALRFLEEKKRKSKQCKNLTLSQFQTQYVSFAQANLAPSTVVLYTGAINSFLHHAGDRLLVEYTPQVIEQYKVVHLKKVSPTKVNIDFRSLKSAFGTAVNWGLLPENPFKKCKQVRLPQMRPVFLTPEDFQKLLLVIQYDWFRDLVRFAVSTMMRVGEIVNLKWSSIDLERRLILVENTETYHTKTRKSRVVPMNEWVYYFLVRKERKNEYVFTFPNGKSLRVGYVSTRFTKYVRKYGRLDKADNNNYNNWDIGVTNATTYDLNGNITQLQRASAGSKNYTYKTGTNTPQTIGSWSYTADVSGNITNSGSSSTALTYDVFTQLTMREVKGTRKLNFQYDGSKERVLKIDSNGTVTKTAYLRGLQDYPVMHKVSTGDERIYVYGLSGLVAVRINSTWYYVHKDHLGSTRVVTNTSASAVARYDFDPYGKIDSSYVNADLEYLFTGQELDETDLWNFRARQFDKEAVIFYAPDPANQGFARYGYCLNNPILLIDQTGRWGEMGYAINGIAISSENYRDNWSQCANDYNKDQGYNQSQLASFVNTVADEYGNLSSEEINKLKLKLINALIANEQISDELKEALKEMVNDCYDDGKISRHEEGMLVSVTRQGKINIMRLNPGPIIKPGDTKIPSINNDISNVRAEDYPKLKELLTNSGFLIMDAHTHTNANYSLQVIPIYGDNEPSSNTENNDYLGWKSSDYDPVALHLVFATGNKTVYFTKQGADKYFETRSFNEFFNGR